MLSFGGVKPKAGDFTAELGTYMLITELFKLLGS
jgi:hypothetical protein